MNTIAEIGINHNGCMTICKELIRQSKIAGFTFVKFQKRNPDVCVPENKKNTLRDTLWGTMTYLEYKYRMEFNRSQYDEIDQYCHDIGIKWFASAFDKDSVVFLAHYLNNSSAFANIIKLGSGAAIDMDLCRIARHYFERVIISLGMKTEIEVKRCIEASEPICVFHTVSTYPTPDEDLFLNYIHRLKRLYPSLEIGYSGHELGLIPTFVAASLGCTWFERHVTLDKTQWGTDHSSSIDVGEMVELIRGLNVVFRSLRIKDCERFLINGEFEKREFFEVSGQHNKVIALIPARGGSQRIPRKNLRLLNGKPLIHWTIEAAIKSGMFDKIIVSTDDSEISQFASLYNGIYIHKRSASAATNEAKLLDVVRDFNENTTFSYDTMIILNPTSPLRNASCIQESVRKYMESDADFLACVSKQPMFLWNKPDDDNISTPLAGYGDEENILNKSRTQDVPPLFVENGAIYGIRRNSLDKNSTECKTLLFELDRIQSVDIDHNVDMIVAEYLF